MKINRKNPIFGFLQVISILLFSFFLALNTVAFSDIRKSVVSFPEPVGYVNDFANVLTEVEENEINELITSLENDTKVEIAVVTIPSTEGLTIEEYANTLFNKWGIGKKGQDNGVLLLIAMKERAIRIEVGYGLEPILPDGLCGEIIRNNMVPYLKAGEVGQALLSATKRIAEIISKKQNILQTRPPVLVYKEPNLMTLRATQVVSFLILFIFPISCLFLAIAKSKAKFKTKISDYSGIILWHILWFGFLYGIVYNLLIDKVLHGQKIDYKLAVFLIPFYLMPAFMILQIAYTNPKGIRKRGWHSGGFGSGSGWGGFGGGGGFGGFGGGSSGGGGASGRW